MDEKKVSPSRFHMGEPAEFGQRYTYWSHHDMAVMLAPGYFWDVRERLRAGDRIDITKIVDGRVRELQEMLVVYARGNEVEMRPIGQRIVVPQREEPQTESEPSEREVFADGTWTAEWGGPSHRWRVKDGAGTILVKGLDEREAKDIANGHVPLIQEQAA